jgi:membrane-associated phospholipid phosphatase
MRFSAGEREAGKEPGLSIGAHGIELDAGLILAELVPEAASDVLARARAFGQSRIVCGVHNASAVEAGWMTATAVFAM